MQFALQRNDIFPETVIHGCAVGVDQAARDWAISRHLPFTPMRPNYKKYPPHLAPLHRNVAMANSADALVTIYHKITGGTLHMQNVAGKRRLQTYQHPMKLVGGRLVDGRLEGAELVPGIDPCQDFETLPCAGCGLYFAHVAHCPNRGKDPRGA